MQDKISGRESSAAGRHKITKSARIWGDDNTGRMRGSCCLRRAGVRSCREIQLSYLWQER